MVASMRTNYRNLDLHPKGKAYKLLYLIISLWTRVYSQHLNYGLPSRRRVCSLRYGIERFGRSLVILSAVAGEDMSERYAN